MEFTVKNLMRPPSMKWLERFLRAYEGAILLVSHDRDFMNALATKVTEIRDAKLVSYAGDYEAFVKQRELEIILARNQLLPQFDVGAQYRWLGVGQDLIHATRSPDPIPPRHRRRLLRRSRCPRSGDRSSCRCRPPRRT